MPYGTPGLFRQFPTDNVAGPPSAAQQLFGSRNVAIGPSAGANAGTNPTNPVLDGVYIGFQAADNVEASGVIAIGPRTARVLPVAGATSLDDSIAIGRDAIDAITETGGVGVSAGSGGIIAIGANALGASTKGHGSVVIGIRAVQGWTGSGSVALSFARNVVIGFEASSVTYDTGQNFRDSVILGFQAANTAAGISAPIGPVESVVIGSEACSGAVATVGANLSDNVIIGFQAGRNADLGTNPNDNVLIGRDCCDSRDLGNGGCVVIGAAANTQLSTDAVVIGHNANCNSHPGAVVIGDNSNALGAGGDNMTLIGPNAQGGGAESIYFGSGNHILTGQRNIVIGAHAGNGETAAQNDAFIVETFISPTRRALLFGNLANGNLCIGNSAPGTSRGFATATNTLKLLDATPPAADPDQGCFLYFDPAAGAAGELQARFANGTIAVVAAA